MSARDELIAHARAQRDEEVDGLIATIDRLRKLEGFELLRGYSLVFVCENYDDQNPATPGFEQAAVAACMMLDGAPDPRDVGRVSFRPTEVEQPSSCRLSVSWRWDRDRGRYAGTTGAERRVWLDELERAWTSAGEAVKRWPLLEAAAGRREP